MNKFFNAGGGDPGLWHLYLSRPEHQNLPLNEVRRRYLLEQADFQQFMMMMNAQSSLTAPGGGRQATQESEQGSGARQGGSSRPDDLVYTIVDPVYDLNDLNALIYVAPGEDARTSQAYYEVWDDPDKRKVGSMYYDLANTYVMTQNPANNQWGMWRYNDFIQGEYRSGIVYTDYEGNSVTSDGPGFSDTDKTGTTPEGTWDGGSYIIGGVWNHANLTNAVVDGINFHPSYFVRITHSSGSAGHDAYEGIQFVTQSNTLINETTAWYPLGADDHNAGEQSLTWSEGFQRTDYTPVTTWYGWRLALVDTFLNTRNIYGSGSISSHPLDAALLNSSSLGNDPMFGNSYFTYYRSNIAFATALLIPTDTRPSFSQLSFTYSSGKGATTVYGHWVGMRNGYGVYKTSQWDFSGLNTNSWIYWDGSGWVVHQNSYTNSSSQATYVSTDPLDPSGVYNVGGVTVTVGNVS